MSTAGLKDIALSAVGYELFSDYFLDDNPPRPKAGVSRFADILSDPSNLLIPRVPDAGICKNGFVTMHNGIEVSEYGYYGPFSDILKINKGCHEPSEERLFADVLRVIKPGSVMIELGSYWCFYTMWFHKSVPNARNYCIEPSQEALDIGAINCNKNAIDVDCTHGIIGNQPDHQTIPKIHIPTFIQEKNIQHIDLLHSDIQGSELELLHDCIPLLQNKQITYLFISTHSNPIHYECIDILKANNYRIISASDFETETFCHDGIIVACPDTLLEIPCISLGNRSKTPVRITPFPGI